MDRTALWVGGLRKVGIEWLGLKCDMSREELPFEVIQTWKPEQPKEFCRKPDLKVSGTKAELVARVFAAAEMGIAIKPTA